ncbi:unnamed protein product [Arctogadus glacialis]
MPVDMQPHQGLYHYESPSSQPPRGLAPSGCSSYSEVSSQRGLLHNGPSQDCRAMYNPMTQPPGMTPGPGPGSQGHGSCMNQYMRPPMGPPPPPHSVMNHRGMMPNEDHHQRSQSALWCIVVD